MDRRFPLGMLFAGMLAAALVPCACVDPAVAQRTGAAPTYQRQNSSMGSGKWNHGDRRHHRFPQQYSSQVSSGSFQRPFPYHLDYYKMKYGGSYAPYFGNLYGPPVNNFFGTPFTGGGWGWGGGVGWGGGPWGGVPWGEFGGPGFGGPGFGGYGAGYGGYGYGGYGAPGYGGPACGAPYGPWAGAVAAPGAPVEGEVVEEALPVN